MSTRDAILRIVSDFETFRAGDGYLSIREKDSRSPGQIADEILALPGWYTEFGWTNDLEPAEPYGQMAPTAEERTEAEANGYRLVQRQRFGGPWEDT